MSYSSQSSGLPTILIILGATGDLAQKKLIPALFRLHQKNLLPAALQIVGFSRQDLNTDDFRALVDKILGAKTQANSATREQFVKFFIYQQGLFDLAEGYDALGKVLGATDTAWRTCANKLFYLAVPPQYYETIFTHLAASGLTKPCSAAEGWTRVIVEKPFGRDLFTAQKLDKLLAQLFKEEQIYRIDHYLGKETVQNILAFRFANSFIAPAWSKDHVESIHIQVLENFGVENRADFYDGVGALRDVGQNHLLQLLALFTMEAPAVFNAEGIRSRRYEILSALEEFTLASAAARTVRGQYAGYQATPGVRPNSTTETYFKIKTFLNAERWAGVPIYLESGKNFSETKAEVSVVFRHKGPCLCPPETEVHHQKNTLRYQIQPQESIHASFWVKRPGTQMILEEKDFAFDYHAAYAAEEFFSPYEKLFLDAIAGNQTLFVSTQEIMASWKFIDPIAAMWARGTPELLPYAPQSVAMSTKTIT